MFPTSSQKKFWTFADEKQLTELRMKQNQKFIDKHGSHMSVNIKKYVLNKDANNILYYLGRSTDCILSDPRGRKDPVEAI